MNFSATEVTLLAIQVLLIPFARFFLSNMKKEILTDIKLIINEHYVGLADLIDDNKTKLLKTEETIKHKAEISKLKQEILNSRIKDIELYLKRENGFQTRQISQIDDSGFL